MVISQEELALIKGVIKKDQQAFWALYERYSAQVHALTLRILGDSMLAEEATQDTFLKLWEKAHQYKQQRGELITWLLTIARSTALDRIRMEARRPTLSTEQDPDDMWNLLPQPASLSDESRWQSLAFAVQALPEEQRLVIDLAYYKGMSQSDIAEVLDWPLGTVKSRVRAGMQSLRAAWLDNI